MIRKIFAVGFLAMVLGLIPATGLVQAKTLPAGQMTSATSVETQSRRFGPYATLRRANEVANYARSLGYNAKVVYAGCLYCGTREYYVDVWA